MILLVVIRKKLVSALVKPVRERQEGRMPQKIEIT